MKKLLILLAIFPFLLNAKSRIDSADIQFTAYYSIKDINGKILQIKSSFIDWKKVNNKYEVSPFQFTFQLKDMKTGDTNRDEHMLEVLGYPEHKEIAINVIKLDYKQDTSKPIILGSIQINGITKPFNSEILIVEEMGKLVVSGKLKISLKDFQIDAPELLFVAVDDGVDCEYKITLVEQP